MGKYKNWEKAAFWSADTDEGTFSHAVRGRLASKERVQRHFLNLKVIDSKADVCFDLGQNGWR